MALVPKNWACINPTASTWTGFVEEPATLATILIVNTTSGAISVQLRIEDDAEEYARIVPPTSIGANETKVLDIRSLNLTGFQALKVRAEGSGMHFVASGVVDV